MFTYKEQDGKVLAQRNSLWEHTWEEISRREVVSWLSRKMYDEGVQSGQVSLHGLIQGKEGEHQVGPMKTTCSNKTFRGRNLLPVLEWREYNPNGTAMQQIHSNQEWLRRVPGDSRSPSCVFALWLKANFFRDSKKDTQNERLRVVN